MRTILRAYTINGSASLDHLRAWGLSVFHNTVVVPEPYQAGDDFTIAFARLPGVVDRLAQYGQQPRQL